MSKEPKQRFIRKTNATAIHLWTPALAAMTGMVECDEKGVAIADASQDNMAIKHELEIAELHDTIGKLEAQLAKQAADFAKKEQVLGEEYKKAKADADALRAELKKVETSAKAVDSKKA